MSCDCAQCILHNVLGTTKVGLVHSDIPTFDIPKDNLIGIVKGLLKTNFGQDFLLQLRKTETDTLAACIRDEVEQAAK